MFVKIVNRNNTYCISLLHKAEQLFVPQIKNGSIFVYKSNLGKQNWWFSRAKLFYWTYCDTFSAFGNNKSHAAPVQLKIWIYINDIQI